MNQKVLSGWHTVLFIFTLVRISSSVVLAAQILATENYPINDKNWWIWNQEAMEKLETLDDTQKKEGKETHKLVLKRSVPLFNPKAPVCASPISKEPPKERMFKKRWLSGSFGFGGRKKQPKESQKWFVDSQISGPNSQPSAQVIQDPWASKKRMQIRQKYHRTDVRPQPNQPGASCNTRKLNFLPMKISSQKKYADNQPSVNADNKWFRASNLSQNKEVKLHSLAVAQLSEQHMKPYENSRPQLPSAIQIRNKPDDPKWGSYKTLFPELKFNPFTNAYLSSSVKWYTTPYYGWVRTSEPPSAGKPVLDDGRLSTSVERENGDVDRGTNGNLSEILQNKGVAKSKNGKANKGTERRRLHQEYELIPKIYALNKLRNVKKHDKSCDDYSETFTNSAANPIIVPGFMRKHVEPHENDHVSLHPYVVRTEERNSPYDEECIQVSRANRNRSNNAVTHNENNKVIAGGIPIQLPSPYAIPGGVNISILVPNPPAASSNESPLSTMTSSTERDKNVKKKKERRKKVKNDDELGEDIISEPRSLVSARIAVRRFPFSEKTGVNPLVGEDDRRINDMKLNYRPPPSNIFENLEHPLFNLKNTSFSLLNHIRNLTLNQLDWDNPSSGIQTEKVKKPFDYGDNEDDDDDIRMLYDEQTASASTFQSEKKDQVWQTASGPWFRLSDCLASKSSVQGEFVIRRYNTPSRADRIPGLGLRSSGSVSTKVDDANYLNHKRYPGDNNAEDEDGRQILPSMDGRSAGVAIRKPNFPLSKHSNGDEARGKMPGDQWDALDETLKSEMSEKCHDVVWRAFNRKREADYGTHHQENDEQSYYRLSAGENSLRNPTNLIMSVFRPKSNKHRGREYYDDIPDESIREQMRPNIIVRPNFPG